MSKNDIPTHDGSPERPEESAADEARLRELLGTLRRDAIAPPSLHASIMREVSMLAVPLWRRCADWLLRPRAVRISPAAGASLAFAASVVLVVTSQVVGGRGEADVVELPSASSVTRFVFVAPDARSVHITGDFAAWSERGIPLQDLRGTGIWVVDVPLEPGTYQYTFIVDGTEWRPDPRAMAQVDDGFGQMNSLVVVTGNGEV